MMITSCRLATIAAIENFHSKRNAKYTMMPITTKAKALAPSLANSEPTAGPTNSVRESLIGSAPAALVHDGRLTDSP